MLQLIATKGFTFDPGAVPMISLFKSPKANSLVSILSNPINLLFCLGIAWFRLRGAIESCVQGIPKRWLSVYIASALMVVSIGYTNVTGHGIFQMGAFSFLLFSATMFLHFMSANRVPSQVYKFVIYLGKISFSLYLCHYLAIDLRTYYLPPGINIIYHPFIVLFFVALISIAFYHLIDFPSSKLGRLLQRRSSAELTAR